MMQFLFLCAHLKCLFPQFRVDFVELMFDDFYHLHVYKNKLGRHFHTYWQNLLFLLGKKHEICNSKSFNKFKLNFGKNFRT